MAYLLNKWSREQDGTLRSRSDEAAAHSRADPGLVIYPAYDHVVVVDWVMSLEPDWFSTMFPILICIGQMLSGLSFMILLLAWLGTADFALRE